MTKIAKTPNIIPPQGVIDIPYRLIKNLPNAVPEDTPIFPNEI